VEKYFLDKGGLLPLLDSHLGSLLNDSRHLQGELGMRFQAYAESCQSAVRAPRGRSLLCMIAQHFRLDLNRGSNLTQQALFDLQLDNFIVRDLEKFVERIEYVLNAILQSHQPSETTKFTWLYSRVKKFRLLQRHIDRITKDSRETSHCRSWDWLMKEIKDVLIEVREDTNERSIRASLQIIPKAKSDPKAAVAHDAENDPKGTKGLPNPSAKVKPKPAPKPKAAALTEQAEKGGKGETQPKAGQRVKVKAKAKMKQGRRVIHSQSLTSRVTKLPHHVCLGRKAHATGGINARFFMIQKRSQRRLHQQMLRQQLQLLLQVECLEALPFVRVKFNVRHPTGPS